MKRLTSHALRLLLTLVAGLGVWAVATAPAHAAEEVKTYAVNATVDPDGTLHVVATITFDTPPTQLTQVMDTATRTTDSREYRFTVSDVRATAGGTDLGAEVRSGDRSTTVTIPTASVTGPVELSYVVKGAAIAAGDGGTVVTWPLVQGLNVGVQTFDATVVASGPGQFTMIDCAAGDPASPSACTFFGGGTHDNPQPVFHHEALAPGQFVEATLRFPAGVVAVNEDLRTLWTMERAFSVGPLELGIALALLVLGGLALWAAHRRFGSDAAGAATPTRVAEFTPVGAGESEFRVLDDVRPGQVGTVLDEHVDPVDITATLLDLAVRGHLRLEELDRPNSHAVSDWSFVRKGSTEPLAAYEQTLLDAVAPADSAPVTVSQLGTAVAPVIPAVQSQLYDDVVKRGWFARRPDTTRNLWTRLGWAAVAVALVVTIVLAAFSTFGLIGIALLVLALGTLFVAAEMPARTTAGASVLSGLQALSGALLTQPTTQLPKGREYDELSKILPYAVVLGGADRWLQALADADVDPDGDGTDLSWYHAPSDWKLADLPASIRNFITTVQGTLFSR